MRSQLDRSLVAQHNDAEHGYWLIIDAGVYDVSQLMRRHPGGARILQLYAGRDASHGFRRVHRDAKGLTRMLEQAHIGTLREPVCATDAEHAEHRDVYRAVVAVLALVVEMQNALRADHAFRLPAAPGPRPCRFELQRGLETHARFLFEYLAVLLGSSLPRLAGALQPCAAALQNTQDAAARSQVLDALQHIDQLSDRALTTSVAAYRSLDSWLLRGWKRELIRALEAFECPHSPAAKLGQAPDVRNLCERLHRLVLRYLRAVRSDASVESRRTG